MKVFNKATHILIAGISFLTLFNSAALKAATEYQLAKDQTLLNAVQSNSKQMKSTQWFRYQVPMEPQNGMPCCYLKQGEMQCSLDKRTNAWVSRSQLEQQDSKTMDIYFSRKPQGIDDMFIAGSECPVDTSGAKLTQITQVSAEQSIQFLNHLIRNKADNQAVHSSSLTSQALAALAHHQGASAHQMLEQYAFEENASHLDSAVFWLGEARNKAGYESLSKLLASRSVKASKQKQAVFALSVNSYAQAKDKLLELAMSAKSDSIRGEAIFWLVQSQHPKALTAINAVLSNQQASQLFDKAVFALSQLKSDRAWQRLVEIARQHQYVDVQRKAVFWLSQNKQRESSEILIEIALGNAPQSVREHAVFAISQLRGKIATQGLVKVLKSTSAKPIKQKAIFWLGQSKDEEAVDYIESLILASNH